MVTAVSRIRHREVARLDADRLQHLVEEYGEPGAERFVGRALEAIAVRLSKAERAWRRGDSVRLCQGARELSDIAGQIGLPSLQRVAMDVSRVAIAGDSAALGATVARMVRLGESSLMAAWELDGTMM